MFVKVFWSCAAQRAHTCEQSAWWHASAVGRARAESVADLKLLDLLAQHLYDVGPHVEVGLVQLAQHERAEVGLARALLVNVLDVADHRHVAREQHCLLGSAAGHGVRAAERANRDSAQAAWVVCTRLGATRQGAFIIYASALQAPRRFFGRRPSARRAGARRACAGGARAGGARKIGGGEFKGGLNLVGWWSCMVEWGGI